jgi:hypothetical protein
LTKAKTCSAKRKTLIDGLSTAASNAWREDAKYGSIIKDFCREKYGGANGGGAEDDGPVRLRGGIPAAELRHPYASPILRQYYAARRAPGHGSCRVDGT